MSAFFERICHPALTDIAINWDAWARPTFFPHARPISLWAARSCLPGDSMATFRGN